MIAEAKPLAELSTEHLAYSNLMGYTRLMNPHYIVARHLIFVGKHLAAVEQGLITRLIICMPPRHGKTMLVSENFIPWYLGRNQHNQVIYTTYNEERAKDVGGRVRDYMLDPFYNEIFSVVPDSQSKSASKLSLDVQAGQKGTFFSVGQGGAVTGRGAHLFLIDDPIKGAREADSATLQRQLRDWYAQVAYTRLMPGRSSIVIVMTRWTYNDLVGFVLREHKHENWVVLNLPAIAESNDILGREKGEALWPEAYNVDALMQIRNVQTTRSWNALYQQSPQPREGGMIDFDDFGRYDWNEWNKFLWARAKGEKYPKPFEFNSIAISWDTAYKEEQVHDPSASTVWAISNTSAYLVWVTNKRLAFPKLISNAKKEWQRFAKLNIGGPPRMLIEDRASGQSMIQTLMTSTRIPVIKCKPTMNKILRLENNTAPIESGRIYLPERAPWLYDYETQLSRFPHDDNDDMVDSTSQFLEWFSKPRRRKTGRRFWK